MKKRMDLLAFVAMLAVAAVIAGCGGDDDDDDGAAPAAPESLAALAGRTLTLNPVGGTATPVDFGSGGTFAMPGSAGIVETYSATGNEAAFRLNPTAGANLQPTTYELTFTTSDSGTYVRLVDGLQDETGSFELGPRDASGSDGGTGDDGGQAGGDNSGTDGVDGVPDTLNGRTVELISALGGSETFTFGAASFNSSLMGSSGGYEYDTSAGTVNEARLVANYQEPSELNGDQLDILMNFEVMTYSGTLTSEGSTPESVNGTFVIIE